MSSEIPSARPPLPPGLVAPSAAPLTSSSAAPAVDVPAGYHRTHTVVVSPKMFIWTPVILFTIAFICTFFPWVGTTIGGNMVDSQGPWRAMFGGVNRNYELEKVMGLPSGWLDHVKSNWELLLPGLLCLVVAVVLAWADRLQPQINWRMTPAMQRAWVWRHTLTAAFGAAAFALIICQMSYGFGLQRAVQKVVTDRFADQRAAVAGSPSRQWDLDYLEEQEYDKFNLIHTFWPYLGLTCLALAVLAILCRLGLERRGTRPPPRLVLQY